MVIRYLSSVVYILLGFRLPLHYWRAVIFSPPFPSMLRLFLRGFEHSFIRSPSLYTKSGLGEFKCYFLSSFLLCAPRPKVNETWAKCLTKHKSIKNQKRKESLGFLFIIFFSSISCRKNINLKQWTLLESQCIVFLTTASKNMYPTTTWWR